MSETREQAIQKLHVDLAHEGESKGCVKCQNLATTLGWDDYPPFTYPYTKDCPF